MKVDKALRGWLQTGKIKYRPNCDPTHHYRTNYERQTSLYLFIDFEKAFDSIDNQVLWNILRHYSIPDNIISIIRLLYDGFTCQVIHGGSLSDPFPVSTGALLVCLLSNPLLLVVIDWFSKFSRSLGIKMDNIVFVVKT